MKKLMDRMEAAIDATMKASAKKTKLDDLADKLHAALRGEARRIIEAGKILIESQDELEHGQWLDWLDKNFDLSQRSAYRYISAARYVERKFATVANFENLAPTLLYELADGDYYNDEEQAVILAATLEGRVDTNRACEIREAHGLITPDDDADDGNDDADDQDGSSDATEEGGNGDDEPDAETEAILDGAPPAPPPPPDPLLKAFNEAVDELINLRTKSVAHFAITVHSADDLRGVEDFLHAVGEIRRSKSASV
jgi:hypothetical protein